MALAALVFRSIKDVGEMILVCFHVQLQDIDFVNPYTQLSIMLTQSLIKGICVWSVANSVICVSQFCEASMFGQQMYLNHSH